MVWRAIGFIALGVLLTLGSILGASSVGILQGPTLNDSSPNPLNSSENGSLPSINASNIPDLNLSSGTPNPDVEEGFNTTLVEREFVELLNDERQSRGLQSVSHRPILTKMGDKHSATMAAHGYIAHEFPDGTSIEDRYRDRGLLPECNLEKRDGTYYPGTENVAKTHVHVDLISEHEPDYIDSERDLAQHLFEMWMGSDGHREAMLVYSADEAGLGLNITRDDEVYAALELC